ncbi:KaiC domain protein, AF_0795 family [Thermanaeromonas toyohensis ToBE]|uniref:KaiC domain protein, AF_0795 family n=1 Tax=Thermanaeromonas toyohensis ToBE TaxID=698762 RepID=A0A1W1VMS4_9FIRM|nr:KaiC domain-containing protein [Thermanaeromonas toyohensis]SMB94685.1 KaiC domain protein, AF_0795 family [Thermanaeromonas toyohensis ToBE]
MRVLKLKELEERIPKLFGIPSGVPGLDDLFFTFTMEEEGYRKVPLKGLPSASVVHLTGVPDTGKTLMAEQFALTQAARQFATLFVTVEVPAPFLAQGLRQRAQALRLAWEEIEDKVFLLELVRLPEVRENIGELCHHLTQIIRDHNIKACVIDSITGLYEGKETAARTIVRRLYEVMKEHYQTAIFISQKRSSHEEISAEAAGGYGVSHILDCTLVLTKMVVSRSTSSFYGKEPGDIVRTVRIDGCRVCGHDPRVHLLEIEETGIVRVGPALSAKAAELRTGR